MLLLGKGQAVWQALSGSQLNAATDTAGLACTGLPQRGLGSRPAATFSKKGTIRHARATASYLPNEIVRPYSKTSGYELRLYQPRYVLQTAYSSRQQAYLLFDQYLTGKNAEKANLEAPAPVVMRHDPAAGSKSMQMFVLLLGSPLDAAALLQQPPFPTDDRLSIDIAGGEVIAAIQFPGQVTKPIAEELTERLKNLLEADGVNLAAAEASGAFRVAQYDPVHSLSERTNELWLAVQL